MQRGELINTQDPRWNRTLDLSSDWDVYQTADYTQLCADEGNAQACAFFYEKKDIQVLFPLILRRIPRETLPEHLRNSDLMDATSPYGLSGPLLHSKNGQGISTEQLQEIHEALKTTLEQAGIVSLFARLHPLFNNFKNTLSYGHVPPTTKSIYIDLDPDYSEIRRRFAKSHKWGINRLKRFGYSVEINNFEYLERFSELYKTTMDRVSARSFYYFSEDYFKNMLGSMGDKLHFVICKDKEQKPIAGGLFYESEKIVQFHLSAADSEHKHLAPGKLVVDEAVKFFKARGRQYLNLGGGLGGSEDSLFTFKSRFSDKYWDFAVWKAVINEEVFCQIMKTPEITSEHYQGYFPPYREKLN